MFFCFLILHSEYKIGINYYIFKQLKIKKKKNISMSRNPSIDPVVSFFLRTIIILLYVILN